VPILVHWSTVLLAGFYAIVNVDRLSDAIVRIAAYFFVLVVHELGHQFMAMRLGYRVVSTEIYPNHGLCRCGHPETQLGAAKIAWGGVIGQFLIATPTVLRLVHYGYGSFGTLRTFLTVCGPSTVAIAVFNLIPVRPPDGAAAWSLFPQLWKARRSRSTKRPQTALEIFEEMARKKGKK